MYCYYPHFTDKEVELLGNLLKVTWEINGRAEIGNSLLGNMQHCLCTSHTKWSEMTQQIPHFLLPSLLPSVSSVVGRFIHNF